MVRVRVGRIAYQGFSIRSVEKTQSSAQPHHLQLTPQPTPLLKCALL
jgi:hypothetical protein